MRCSTTRAVDVVGDAAHRAERGIELQAADRTRFLVRQATRGGRLVADAVRDLEAHVQRDVLGQMADHVVRIDDLDRVIDLDVAGGDDALALLAERKRGLVAAVHADGDVLEVQQNLDDVFLQAFERGVLVQHAVDLDFGDRAAGNRRQQHAAQRVAQRMAETAFQRFDDDLRAIGADALHLDAARTQHVG